MTADIQIGDVVMDLSQKTPLHVVGISPKTAEEHEYVRGDKVAEMFDVAPDETLYECAFLPAGDDQISPPKRTYSYPESRLLRFPSERPTSMDRIQTELRNCTLQSIVDAADDDVRTELLELIEGVYNGRTADRIRELAEADDLEGGESA